MQCCRCVLLNLCNTHIHFYSLKCFCAYLILDCQSTHWAKYEIAPLTSPVHLFFITTLKVSTAFMLPIMLFLLYPRQLYGHFVPSCIPTWYTTLRLEKCIHIWRDWWSLSSNTGQSASFCLLFFKSEIFFCSLLRSVAYSHSGGQVERPEVRVRPLSWTGHRLLFLLWPDAAQTQAETGRWHGGKIMTTAGTRFYDLSLCFFFSLIHGVTSLSRCPTWAARRLPFCLTTSITPCVRPTARPFRHSPTLRSL